MNTLLQHPAVSGTDIAKIIEASQKAPKVSGNAVGYVFSLLHTCHITKVILHGVFGYASGCVTTKNADDLAFMRDVWQILYQGEVQKEVTCGVFDYMKPSSNPELTWKTLNQQ